ncbi:MAG: preprotein translocase subunit SecA, partial [Mesorhizobium sp.]
PWINKALEKAQKKVEARNFDIRKNLLKYDDVSNDQRKVVFEQRIELMDGEGLSETIAEMREGVIDEIVAKAIPENAYAKERAERFGPEVMNYVERSVVLQTLDHLWREHIVNLDHLRSVVGFRGYAQRDPLQEYKGEAFELFQAMLGNLRQAVTAQLMRVELVRQAAEAPPPEAPDMFGTHIDGTTGENDFEGGETALLVRPETTAIVAPEDRDPNNQATWGKVGRNEACPCGSGKKYKHCH